MGENMGPGVAVSADTSGLRSVLALGLTLNNHRDMGLVALVRATSQVK